MGRCVDFIDVVCIASFIVRTCVATIFVVQTFCLHFTFVNVLTTMTNTYNVVIVKRTRDAQRATQTTTSNNNDNVERDATNATHINERSCTHMTKIEREKMLNVKFTSTNHAGRVAYRRMIRAIVPNCVSLRKHTRQVIESNTPQLRAHRTCTHVA